MTDRQVHATLLEPFLVTTSCSASPTHRVGEILRVMPVPGQAMCRLRDRESSLLLFRHQPFVQRKLRRGGLHQLATLTQQHNTLPQIAGHTRSLGTRATLRSTPSSSTAAPRGFEHDSTYHDRHRPWSLRESLERFVSENGGTLQGVSVCAARAKLWVVHQMAEPSFSRRRFAG